MPDWQAVFERDAAVARGLLLPAEMPMIQPGQEGPLQSAGHLAGFSGFLFRHNVSVSLVAFALAIEQLGLVLSILLLVGIGALAARGIRVRETLAAALGLIALAWVIFVLGLGLPILVWPDW